MVRASEISDLNNPIDRTLYNPLVQDYLSQTEVTDQNIASTIIVVAGKKIKVDTIDETTGAGGVTIDSCLIKDGLVADSNLLGGKTLAEIYAIIRESTGPTDLAVGAIADGQYLKRSGANVIGAAGTAQAYKLPFDYTIYYSAPNYYAMDIDGNNDYSGAVLATVFNSAEGNLTSDGGRILLQLYGSHNVAAALGVDKRVKVYGMGAQTTRLNVTGAVNCFEIDDANTVATGCIQHLQIDMNQNTGHGIFCDHLSGLTPYSGEQNQYLLNDLIIWDIKAGKAGIYIKDIYTSEIRNVNMRTYGTGLYLGVDNSYGMNYGNSYFENITVKLQGNDTVGIDCAGSTQRSCTLSQWNRIQTFVKTGVTGAISFRSTGNFYNTLTNLTLENNGIGLYLDGCRQFNIVNPYIHNSTPYAIQLENDTYALDVWGGLVHSQATYSVHDNSTASGQKGKNRFHSTRIYKNFNNENWTELDRAFVWRTGAGAAYKCSLNSGLETITIGNSSVIVTHNLCGTPDSIRLTGLHSEVANLFATTIGSQYFTIVAKDGNVTDNRNVQWIASYKNTRSE